MKLDESIVEVFQDFLDDVNLTYGAKIASICRKKLEAITDFDKVDELKILAEAKKEAGFRRELSTLSASSLHFCS